VGQGVLPPLHAVGDESLREREVDRGIVLICPFVDDLSDVRGDELEALVGKQTIQLQVGVLAHLDATEELDEHVVV
jgi:hypothetical protein